MHIQFNDLIQLATQIFQSAGCEPEEARRVSERLVKSNLVGHDSHGVIRIPSYVQWLADGKVLANQNADVITSSEAITVVDGKFGLGQTIGEQAVQIGIHKASQHGVAVVALRNSGHLGRIGDWAEQAAAAGMISLHFVNTSGAGMLVAPFGGIDRRLSANPLAVGVPREDDAPIILDMSACTIAEGKIRVALNHGLPVAEGCLIDADGKPTTNAKEFYADPPGAILPVAGHKGSGLSLMIELLAGALTGSSCSNPANASRVANGMLSIFIDRNFFGDSSDFFPEVQQYIEFVKTSRTTTPEGEILMPGEIEARTRIQRMSDGITLDDVTWAQICATARHLDVKHDYEEPDIQEDSGCDNIAMPGCRVL